MIRPDLATQQHVLYRFFNAADELLYVGITNNPGRRFDQHGDTKPWWTEVANIRMEVHPDRAAVLEAERHAVATEHPKHNVRLRERPCASPGRRPRTAMTTNSTGKKPDRNRLERAIAQDADPGSLVGSFFHGQGGRFHTNQGCIVAEPMPGIYLVEFFSWLMGESTNQQLVPIAQMTEWLFYDDAEWMTSAYEHGVQQRWDRERKEEQARREREQENLWRARIREACDACSACDRDGFKIADPEVPCAHVEEPAT